jgi:hypothetical protein
VSVVEGIAVITPIRSWQHTYRKLVVPTGAVDIQYTGLIVLSHTVLILLSNYVTAHPRSVCIH